MLKDLPAASRQQSGILICYLGQFCVFVLILPTKQRDLLFIDLTRLLSYISYSLVIMVPGLPAWSMIRASGGISLLG